MMNGRGVARRSEFLKKLSKKMVVRSAVTINGMGGKSIEIQTHFNNGHNPILASARPTPRGGVQLKRGGLCVMYPSRLAEWEASGEA